VKNVDSGFPGKIEATTGNVPVLHRIDRSILTECKSGFPGRSGGSNPGDSG
jgi:hypothetical protein